MKAGAYSFLLFVFRLQITECRNVVDISQGFSEQKEQQWDKTGSNLKAMKEFSFASYYGNHMVLQRAPHRAIVWGYHPDPGNRIIIQVKGRNIYSAIVDETGVWKVSLDPESSPGPFSIVAHSETKAIHLKNVLFGDVWLCSGQNNMAFTLDEAFNWTREIKEARHFQQVRVFTAQRRYSKHPLVDLDGVLEPWSLPKKTTLGDRGQYFSAICWLYGKYLYQKLGYPIGLIDITWGDTPIESWMSADALKKCGLSPQGTAATRITKTSNSGAGKGTEERSSPSTCHDHGELWNAMIHPFQSMTIYGVIWDQGEGDASVVSYRNNYNCTFPALIDDWRSKFSAATGGQTSPDFPFGFVQIGASYNDSTTSTGYPDIRWHQTADYGYVPNPRMKNTFMAVTIDITDFSSPFGPMITQDKQDITYRLFLGGLSVAYNISSFWQGPLPISVTRLVDTMVLNYGKKWTLELRQKDGFELCCSQDGSKSCQLEEGKAWWVPTLINSSNATHIELDAGVCRHGQRIVGLRYAWRLSPCSFKRCAVYSTENALPAPPFVAYPKGLGSGGNVSQMGATFSFDCSNPVHL